MARKVVLRYLLVLAVLGVVVIPFLWIVLGSLRPNSELIKPGAQFDVGSVSLDNYENLGAAADYGTFLKNSLIVALITTAISVPLAMLAAYSLYRTRYRGRQFLFRLMIVTYVVPRRGAADPALPAVRAGRADRQPVEPDHHERHVHARPSACG